MIVTETTPVAQSALPVARLKEHLRLASGFAEDQIQDALLAGFLRAALTAIETRTSKALIRRAFTITLNDWAPRTRLPMAPVAAITGLSLKEGGTMSALPASQYALEEDAQAPVMIGHDLPGMGPGRSLVISLEAGYAASFDAIPADLAQAVMMLAAHYYEYRNETALGAGCMPFGVTALIEGYRPLRIGMGADA